MKRYFFTFLFLLLFVFNISAQTKEARKINEFGIIRCGDFMARMDSIFVELQNTPNSEIHVIYYGGRYRKNYSETRNYRKLKLEYAHREDGLNWAKSIPLYISTDPNLPTAMRDLLKEKVILVNGGYRENSEVEIWLVPKDSESPEPTPTINENDIRFRADNPRRTPNFACCYGGCE
jgi:hypothetical protein